MEFVVKYANLRGRVKRWKRRKGRKKGVLALQDVYKEKMFDGC